MIAWQTTTLMRTSFSLLARMVFRSLREYRRVGRLLSRDSAWLGRCWAATRLWCGAAMPFFTIPPGAWVLRASGRTRHSLLSPALVSGLVAHLPLHSVPPPRAAGTPQLGLALTAFQSSPARRRCQRFRGHSF